MSQLPSDITFTELIERIADHHPEMELRFGDRAWSPAELLDRSARLAAGMREWGVGLGSGVAIWMKNRLEWLEVWAAVARLGAVIVPLNTRFSPAETEYVLSHSGATHLVWAAGAGGLESAELGRIRSGCAQLGRIARLDGDPELESEVRLDSLRADDPVQTLEQPGAVGMIQYTSGSTAFPKGARLRTSGLVRNGHGLGAAWGMTSADRVLCSNPLFHCGGSVFAFMAGFTHGASVTLTESWRVESAVELMLRERVTVAPVIDAALRDLVAHSAAHSVRLPDLRLASTAADRVLFERVHKTLGCEISNVYGLTEASPNCCVGDLNDPLEMRLAHIGRAQTGVSVEIRDPESGERMPVQTPGEIVVKGWNVMEGYHADESANQAAFTADGYLRTGDLGLVRSDGYLDYLGRVKLMIKSGGENIAIEEVETVLRSHPAIADAVVVPVPHERFTEVGFAYLRPREGVAVEPGEVLAMARERIAGFKVPKHACLAGDLPRTGSGKVDRVLLAEQARQEVA